MASIATNGIRHCRFVVGVMLLTGCCTGCITVSSGTPSFSLKSLTGSRVQQASYEQKIEEAPRDPKNPAQLKLAYAMLMEEAGKLDEARKHYLDVTELQPKNPEGHLGLARIAQKQDQPEIAEEAFRKAVKLAPDHAPAQYGLGQFYAAQGDWKAAAEALNRAMLSAPDNSEYRYQLAVALVQTGDIDAALPHFIRTIGDAEAHYNVGLILQQSGKWEDAERQFQIALTKKPDLTQAQQWLVHLRQNRQSPTSGPASSPVLPAGHSTSAMTSAVTTPDQSGKPDAPHPLAWADGHSAATR